MFTRYASTGLQVVLQHIRLQFRKNRRQTGFSLLEALTALAVLSITMSALMNSYSLGLQGARVTESRKEATILAHNILSEIMTFKASQIGTRTGNIQDYTWQVNTSLAEKNMGDKKKDKRLWGLYRVNIAVKRRSEILVELEAFKMGEAGA